MADYWKSQPRKFCEFCKCWFGDNKASIDFHERGKKHQDNVKRKINEVRDKATSDAKSDKSLANTMKAMEEAALQSLKADVAGDPSLAAQYGVNEDMAEKIVALTKAKEAKEKAEREAKQAAELAAKEFAEKRKTCLWVQAKSDEGYSYYYNKKTKETTWTKPNVYISVEEQKQIEEERKAKRAKKEEKKAQKRSAEDNKTVQPKVEVGPELRRPGLGTWQPVQTTEPSAGDLELPSGAGIYSSVQEASSAYYVPDEDDEISITEKSLPSVSSKSEPVAFKKRKATSRNVRKKDAD